MIYSLRDGHLRRVVDEALELAGHRLRDRPAHDWAAPPAVLFGARSPGTRGASPSPPPGAEGGSGRC
ncbi:hypothetical protein QFZ75_006682 [Streptomyces sp. V3I8]|nr:hypothetical protein [Streptomyces sp. V3I8]